MHIRIDTHTYTHTHTHTQALSLSLSLSLSHTHTHTHTQVADLGFQDTYLLQEYTVNGIKISKVLYIVFPMCC